MNRKFQFLLTAVGAAALAIMIGAAFVSVSSAAPVRGGPGSGYKPVGVTFQNIVNVKRSGLSSAMVALAPQSSPELLARATKVGPHAASSTIKLSFALKLRNVPALKQFLRQVQYPGSPRYHQWLTPAEFISAYGPSKNNVARLTAFLHAHGIRVLSVSANRELIHTVATTETYQHALGIRINDYRLKGQDFYASSDRPKLPRAIAPLVTSIMGLDHGVLWHPHLVKAAPRANVKTVWPQAAPPPATTGAYLNQHQFAKAYDWPSVTDPSNGAGQTIAILSYTSAGLSPSDYHTYWTAMGVPDHSVSIVNVDGSPGAGGEGETTLDIEYSGFMAPGANIILYEGSTPTSDVVADTINRMVADNIADSASTSWGTCDAGVPNIGAIDALLMQAAAQGISMSAAAGDRGASDGCGGPSHADYPSSSPYVLAANGTILTISDTSGTYESETTWSGTGGGDSDVFSQPSWQTGPGVPNSGHRMNGDMAMHAGGKTLLYYQNGQWITGFVGTSFVAPEFAGLFAVGDSQNGGRLGQSNKLIYADANNGHYASDFRDVTTGSNGHPAGSNWDYPTGWGSPKAASLLSHLGIQGPEGTLAGIVTAAAGGSTIAGAIIVATGPGTSPTGYQAATRDDGTYSRMLPVGTFAVTVSKFGFSDGTSTVTITKDQTATRDFALTKAPTVTLAGKVSDGSGHGYGLLALVKISTEGAGQVGDVWTNPKTGRYSIDLPKGTTYTLNVSAILDGYSTASKQVTLAGDKTENFALPVTSACAAPGYSFVTGGLSQDFNGVTFPPAGWSVTHTPPFSVSWTLSEYVPQENGNYTGGTGNAADADSNEYGSASGSYDTSLITPPIAVTSLHGASLLKYKANYIPVGPDALDLDISTDGGATWTNILHWTTPHGTLYSTPGVSVEQDLAQYLPASGDFQLRWRYYDPIKDWDWYAQIDDVEIGHCEALSGGIVFGGVTDSQTSAGVTGATVSDDSGASIGTISNTFDPSLPAGFYMYFAKSGNRSLTASKPPYLSATAQVSVANDSVTQQNFELKSATFKADPGAFTMHVKVGNSATASFALSNDGDGTGTFTVVQNNGAPPIGAQASGPFATPPTYKLGTNLAAMHPSARHLLGGGIPGPESRGVFEPRAAGDVVSSFSAGIPLYGLGVDRNAEDLWLGSPAFAFGGDDGDHRFLPDGTNTGDIINVSNPDVLYMADMAFDDNTGMLWQLSVDAPTGNTSHIYELNPVTMQPTGKNILVPSPQSERGLAFDPVSKTWYAGDFSSGTIYHFDASGKLLDSAYVNLLISGLAYNPSTGLLFVLTTGGRHAVFVLDTRHNYAQLGFFDIDGFDPANAGSGFGYNCAGNLIATDEINDVVYAVDSTQSGWCDHKKIPWLTVAPTQGTLTPGAMVRVALGVNGTGQEEFTTSQGFLRVTGSPQPTVVPITVHWDARPVNLKLSGNVTPTGPIEAGDTLSYDVMVENLVGAEGPASQVRLSYEMPEGVKYIASNGAQCEAPTTGSSSGASPAAVTGPATVVCDLDSIEPDKGKLVTIGVRATAAASSISATFEADAREPDNDTSDNTLVLDTNPAVGPPGPTGPKGPKGDKGSGGLAFGDLALLGLLAMAGAVVETRRRRNRA